MGIGILSVNGKTSTDLAAETATRAGTVLVIDGAIAEGKASFDLAQLQALPATQVTTMTPWNDGESRYDGVRIRDLLEGLGAAKHDILADAVNDYQVMIPREDVRDYDVIVAYAKDGRPLPEDDKGPLWIIYPFSEHTGLQKDLYFSRSVWQLNRLSVQ